MASRRRIAGWTAAAAALAAAVWAISVVLTGLAGADPEVAAGRLLLPALNVAVVILALALIGLLVRNLVKLVIDRRRGILGARLHAKLVLFVLGFVLVPALLMVYGSGAVIKRSVEAVVRQPVEDIATYSREIVDDWNGFLRQRCLQEAQRLAADVGAGLAARSLDPARTGEYLESWRDRQFLGYATLFVPGSDPISRVDPDVELSADEARTLADGALALAAECARSGEPASRVDLLGRGLLVHAVAPVPGYDGAGGRAVLAVGILHTQEVTAKMKLISGQVDAYRRFRLENRELIRLYLTLIGLVLLVTLFLSTWIGFYVGRRITEPIKAVAGAAREISAGNLDVRVDDRAGDEVGVLIDAFNDMAAQLQESRAVIQRSNADLLSSNRELDERRRYIETLVASLSTAVLSLDHEGRVTTSNPAVERVVGKRIEPGTSIREAFDPPGLAPLREFVLCEIANDTGESSAELVLDRGGAVVTVSARVATLGGRRGEPIGRLLMVEDVTDVVLAQRAAAWREAARRIAHEIKNPLTPIQLSAQRLRKKFADGAPDLAAVVADATSAIEREVGGLKYLVDEFSRYARMPELRLESVDPAEVVRSVVALYAGESGIVWDVRAEPGMPPVRIDPEQIRRVLINLVDNSIAAMRRRGMIAIAAGVDPARRSLRLEVADSGPGIPSAERDRLFVPYFSTKHAGTGLGLAIVQRVVSEHRGTIHVEDNVPRGARFVIEIPV